MVFWFVAGVGCGAMWSRLGSIWWLPVAVEILDGLVDSFLCMLSTRLGGKSMLMLRGSWLVVVVVLNVCLLLA